MSPQPNSWQSPGEAEFDLRSDTITRPTESMLQAISRSTLSDDVFQEDQTTNSLQEYIAQRTGHDAGLLVLSGTMGNQVAIRTHLSEPPYSVICDRRAHILQSEAGNDHYLTLEDIQENAVLSNNIHRCPTRLISLENTLYGLIMPLQETARIVNWAHAHDIKVHLDGARLWDAAVSGAGSLYDYAHLFDSVSLCFSKGLGAPIGSIIVGSRRFIDKARWFRKSIGGGIRQAGILAAAARVGVDEVFGHGPCGEGGKLQEAHDKARRVAEMWTRRGGKLLYPVQTNMVWVDVSSAGLQLSTLASVGKSKGLRLGEQRIVIHHQISERTLQRLEEVFHIVLNQRQSKL
ncbi:hypothetical protein FE257_012049 [Aspergillus nanangensis]|uniref:Aromatic amino acid beta-eliminating lyase/threonine aldolase domain-containing protein n=1 Tax=Aspergillus nanangensis TaxID=2582783 RepID=A0AAD4CGM9_ASPNN|nr:hypothetical protein FE257_012049 [Aspergillus nanangensis]